MTLRQPNIDRLMQLGLSGMAEALEEQRDIADVDQLGFDDRLALMIEREAEHRDHKSYLGHLRQAQLRIRADIQDIDCRAGRGIARTTLTQLAAGDWIRQGHNLVLGGPTGSGKTFVACALAHQACRQHLSVFYRRVPELVAALTRARDKGTHERLMGRLGKVSLLVLDDWGLQGFSAEGRRDLLEIVEQRHGRKSILIASQIPVEGWPKVIGEPTIADAVLDRIVHNAYRIELSGESQRKRNKPPPLDGSGNRAPALKAGVHGRLRRLPGCEDGGARRHAMCGACRRAPKAFAGPPRLAYARTGLASGQPLKQRRRDPTKTERDGTAPDPARSNAARTPVKSRQNRGQVHRNPHRADYGRRRYRHLRRP